MNKRFWGCIRTMAWYEGGALLDTLLHGPKKRSIYQTWWSNDLGHLTQFINDIHNWQQCHRVYTLWSNSLWSNTNACQYYVVQYLTTKIQKKWVCLTEEVTDSRISMTQLYQQSYLHTLTFCWTVPYWDLWPYR